MPRKRHVPSYRLHKPSGQAVVTIDGRDHYLGPHGSPESHAEYDRLVADWLLRQKPGTLSGTARTVTVAEVLNLYEREAARRRQLGGDHRQYRRVLLACQAVRDTLQDGRSLADLPAAEFGPLALLTVRDRLAATSTSRKHVNQRIGCVKAAFRFAAERELIPGSVAAAVWALRPLRRGEAVESAPIRPVSVRDLALTLRQLGRVVADLVRLVYLTGCRPGECCQLTPGLIDRQGRDLDGKRHEGLWSFQPKHKTAKHGAKVVFLGPRAQRLLAPYLEDRDPDAACFSPAEAVEDQRQQRRLASKSRPRRDQPRKASPQKTPGQWYSAKSLGGAVADAAARAGVPHWHPGQLRHTRATQVRARWGPDHARIYLGHKLPGTTGIYAEGDLAKAAEVARAIG